MGKRMVCIVGPGGTLDVVQTYESRLFWNGQDGQREVLDIRELSILGVRLLIGKRGGATDVDVAKAILRSNVWVTQR